MHSKPIALLDVERYWQPLVSFLQHVREEGFLRGTPADLLIVDDNAERMLERLRAFHPPATRRWIRPGET